MINDKMAKPYEITATLAKSIKEISIICFQYRITGKSKGERGKCYGLEGKILVSAKSVLSASIFNST